MHRHDVGVSAAAIVLTTVAVSQMVPTMTVTAAGVVRVLAPVRGYPTRRVSPVAPDIRLGRGRVSHKLLGRSVAAKLAAMKFLDPQTERAVRAFLARVPADVRLDHAILYGSRARGEDRPDSDADVALIIAEGAADWQLVGTLADLAYEVFLESGILIQPVPVSLVHWRHPERFPRPGFLRNVAREGIVL
jgi:predicted nucleotidyltransferase